MGSEQTILVVEEDATCRAFLADNLAEDGYQVASAETRDQALALLADRRAHLVLADLNGETLGLLDAVRGAGGLRDGIDPHVPLVVLSSRTDELARVRALERGACPCQGSGRRRGAPVGAGRSSAAGPPRAAPEARGRRTAWRAHRPRRARARAPERARRSGCSTQTAGRAGRFRRAARRRPGRRRAAPRSDR